MTSENSNQEHSQSKTGSNESDNYGQSSEHEVTPIPDPRIAAPPPSPRTHYVTTKSEKNWMDYVKFGGELLGLLVLIVYTTFAALQWLQIRWTNRLTREALDGSDKQLQQTLTKMQGQIDQIKRLADRAGIQADQAVIAANAARITNEQLIRTQRAFVSFSIAPAITPEIGMPLNKVIGGNMELRWDNSGTTPTKDAIARVHNRTRRKEIGPQDHRKISRAGAVPRSSAACHTDR